VTKTIPPARRANTWIRHSMTAVLAIAMLCSAFACAPSSGWTPIQAGIFNPGQLFTEETHVYGLRLSLPYTRNADLYGIDTGIVGTTESLTGIQANFLFNETQEATGLQMAILQNASTQTTGFQLSMLNVVEQSFTGFQLGGLVNSAEEAKGVQLAGLHNRSESVVGLQITSLVNETNDLRGLQIGALNFNGNGLLPFFPIFNFGWGSDSDDEQ